MQGAAPPAETPPATGLQSSEARRRLAEHGPNALPEAPPRPLWRRFAAQLHSALVYVLLVALVVDVSLWLLGPEAGVPFEAVAIAAILLLNAGLGTWQEYRAEHALARLRELEAPRVHVLRDGRVQEIESRELVPGDVMRVETGARIAADARVGAGGGSLLVDESLLTGESVPVERAPGEDLSSGTLVVRGATWAEVLRTGAGSSMGRIARLLGEVRAEPTPLEVRLDRFGRQIARWVVALALLLVAGGVWADGWRHVGDVFLWAVALAVAAVPEGLPAVLALTLALGVERMSHRRAVVRKLAAVEALGSVTVIATDKTGTLTENRMSVRRVEGPDPERALRAMVLACDAEPDVGIGDPLELALFEHARSQGIDPIRLRAESPRRGARAFDSAWRFMRASVVERGAVVSYLKGAPEALLERSALPEGERMAWAVRADEAAAEGLRVLALAAAEGEAEHDLQWLGLVLLWDPPRPEVEGAIREARAAGVRVVMVTGDHPATAAAIARDVGIEADRVLSGDALARLPRDELRERVARVDVFARVAPEHKLALVEALRARGEVVAMTGDGVNDAPALKRADVGVAMGRRGSDVSREVADLVLLDDNFATIVAAIEEGRNIYENIQSFIRFLFSTNVALVLLVALGSLGAGVLGLRDPAGLLLVPLTAAQLLWINVIADGPPALAVALDRSPGLMRRRPRPRDAPLLDARAVRFVLATGCAKAAVGLALLVALPWAGLSTLASRTAVFLYETLAQLAFVYPSRQLSLRPRRNPVLDLIVAVSVVIQPAIVLLPGMRELLGLEWVDLAAWGWLVAGVTVSWLFAEVYTRRASALSRADG